MNQYSVKCVGDLKLILTLIFKTAVLINLLKCHEFKTSLGFAYRMLKTQKYNTLHGNKSSENAISQ